MALGVLAGGGVWWSRGRKTATSSTVASAPLGGSAVGAGTRAPDTRSASGQPLQLRVQPGAGAGRHVAGRVTFGGAPFAGAVVELRPSGDDDGPGLRVESGADGAFDFGPVAPAPVEIAASAPGKAPATLRLSLADPTVVPAPDALELVLGVCKASVYGTVLDASGGPIARARLHFGAAVVETDEQGRYDRCIGAGARMLFTVTAEGYGNLSTSLEGIGRARRDFSMTPEATLSGRVVRAGDRTPVAGATVIASPTMAMPPTFPMPRRARTGEDGRFELGGLRAGTYYVGPWAPGMSAGKFEEVAAMPGGSTELELELMTATIIHGRVVANGVPVPGVVVRDGQSFDEHGTISQADGSFVMELGGRDTTYTFETWPHKLVKPVTAPADGGTHDVVLEVVARAAVRGRVVHDGKPVGGADVYCERGFTSSLPDGSFELRGLEPGTYEVQATSEVAGAFADGVKVTLTAGEVKDGVVLDLALGGSIAGKVVDQAGAAMAGVNVRFSLIDGNDFGRGTTGPDGTFFAGQLRGGGAYRAEVLSGTSDRPLAPVGGTFAPIAVAGPKAHVEGVVLRVRFAHKTTMGRVVDSAGAPVPDVTLSLRREDSDEQRWFSPSATSVTDAQGAFRFDDLDEGAYTLTAQAPDHRAATQRVIAGGAPAVVRLEALGHIDGSFTGFTDPRVTAVGQGARRNEWRNATVTGTMFRVDVAAGTYLVRVDDAAGGSASQHVDVAPGATVKVSLANPGKGKIAGRVLEVPGDTPVGEGQCAAGVASEGDVMFGVGNAEVGKDGAFALEVAAGSLIVRCYAERYSLGEANVAVERGGSTPVTVRLVRRGEGERGMLGIELGRANVILRVLPETPAASAGLRVGETISGVDGVATTGLGDDGVMTLIGRHAAGQVVTLELTQGDAKRTVSATLARQER